MAFYNKKADSKKEYVRGEQLPVSMRVYSDVVKVVSGRLVVVFGEDWAVEVYDVEGACRSGKASDQPIDTIHPSSQMRLILTCGPTLLLSNRHSLELYKTQSGAVNFQKDPTFTQTEFSMIKDTALLNKRIVLIASGSNLSTVDLLLPEMASKIIRPGNFTHVKVAPCGLFFAVVEVGRGVLLFDSDTMVAFHSVRGTYTDVKLSSDFVLARDSKWKVIVNLSDSKTACSCQEIKLARRPLTSELLVASKTELYAVRESEEGEVEVCILNSGE